MSHDVKNGGRPARAAIVTARLSKRFGHGATTARALEDVSLTVNEGEVFALLGANGAGKSTLVRILATLLQPSEGSVQVAGIDVARRPADARRALGVALQSVGIDPAQRVRDLLRLHARLHGFRRRAARERAAEMLRLLRLDEVAETRVAKLSGGLRRRTDLALALVHRPRVLLLDEPTTGLDPSARRALWREIASLRTWGVTVLLTTQQLEEAERLADRVAILAAGRIAAVGSPTELKRQLSHTVLEATFADRRQASAAAALLGPDAATAGAHVRAPMTGAPEVIAEALARFRAQGLSFTSLTLSPPTLEDVFLAQVDPTGPNHG